MKKINFPLAKVYQLLEPCPVIMVSTSYQGKPNVMTMSWYMMVDFEPPLVAVVMGAEDYSFTILQKTKECVINIPAVHLARTIVKVGNSSGKTVDKWKKFKLTPIPSEQIAAPRVGECFASFECKVVNGTLAEKYNIFILEVVQAWAAPAMLTPGSFTKKATGNKRRQKTLHHWGHGIFTVDGHVIKIPTKMPK